VSPKAKWFAEALSWSAVLAVLITGALHVLAVTLPEHYSSHGARQASAMEQRVNAFSAFWLNNSPWFPAVLAAVCFALSSALWLLARRAKFSTPHDSGAG
jgi:hypothetical protein